jgi:hypothetical protein
VDRVERRGADGSAAEPVLEIGAHRAHDVPVGGRYEVEELAQGMAGDAGGEGVVDVLDLGAWTAVDHPGVRHGQGVDGGVLGVGRSQRLKNDEAATEQLEEGSGRLCVVVSSPVR